jgi:hypothetical protein
VIIQIPIVRQTEFGHRSDAGAGVGEHAEHGAIAQPNHVVGVDRVEQLARLLDGELGGFTFGHAVFEAAHGSERIEGHRVTLHQGGQKLPQCSIRNPRPPREAR